MQKQSKIEDLEKYILENYINVLVKTNKNTRVISEKDLKMLHFSKAERNFINQILEKNKIEIAKEILEKKDRTKAVKNYTYGEMEEIKARKYDKPFFSKLEYDAYGNLIYEDWKKLDEFLEKNFIPDNIQMNKRRNKEYGEIIYYPSIQLSRIVKLQLCEEEMEHIFHYLNENGIQIRGTSSTVAGETENYEYISTYKESKLPDIVSSEMTLLKLKRYSETHLKELRDEIIVDNMRLARWIAYKLSMTTGINIHELESYAFEGLINAVENFDIRLGNKFSTYAYPVIYNNILNGIPEIKGYKKGEFYNKFSSTKKEIEKMNTILKDNTEEVEDIVKSLIDNGKISKEIEQFAKTKILLGIEFQTSLEELMDRYEETEESEEEKLIYDFNYQLLSQDNLLELQTNNSVLNQEFEEILSTLPKFEEELIKIRFGFDNNGAKCLHEVGEQFNTNIEFIRQKEAHILRKLRHTQRVRHLKQFINSYDQYNYEPNPLKVKVPEKRF